MKEIISYLDNVGHTLGIGGFEGMIGAFVIILAALVIVVHSFSLLRRGASKRQIDGHLHNPLEWMEDADKTIGCDQQSKNSDPSWANLIGNSYHNIKYRKDA